MAGVGSAWGSREELLHPRDSKGRFRASWKMAEGVVDKIMGILDKFNPRTFENDEQAQAYVHSVSRGRGRTYKPGIDKFLRNFGPINAKLNKGDTSDPSVKLVDSEMRPLPDGLILTRTMTPESFGLTAANIGQIEELTGKLVNSKGYTSTSIGTPYDRQPGRITMTIAAPAGTKALVPNTSQPSKEVILSRDQPLRITKVDPDGQGGFNILAVATGESEGETPVDISRAIPDKDAQEEVPTVGTDAGAGVATGVPGGGQGGAAGTGPQVRNDGHVGVVGQGQGGTETGTEVPGGVTEEIPPIPEKGTDSRNTFRDAFEKAKLQIPSVGTRRKQYMDAYAAVASGKKTPQEAVNELDNHIAMNKRILASDKEDGTDSGPLPEDIRRQEALRDLIAEHFNFTGRKEFKESESSSRETPEGLREKARDLLERDNSRASRLKAQELNRRADQLEAAAKKKEKTERRVITKEEFNKQNQVKDQQKDKKTTSLGRDLKDLDAEIGRKERERKAAIRKEVRDREAGGEAARKKEQEERAAREKELREQEVESKISAEGAKVRNQWLIDSGVKEDEISDLDTVGLKVIADLVGNKKISKTEAKRRLLNSRSATLKKIGESISVRAPRKTVPPKKTAGTKAAETPGDIDKMTIPQLREEAKRQNKKIPSTTRRKADIVALLKGEPSSRDKQFREDSEAIRETPKKETPKKVSTGEMSVEEYDRRVSTAKTGKAAEKAAPIHYSGGSASSTTEGLSEEESSALRTYADPSTSNAIKINKKLRDSKGKDVSPEVVAIDGIMERSELEQDIVVHRAIARGSGVFKWSDDLTGQSYTDHAFVSTSTNGAQYNFSEGGDSQVHMRVLVPKGTSAISANEIDANEMLLDRGLTYSVVADHGVDEDGIRQLDVVVSPGGKPEGVSTKEAPKQKPGKPEWGTLKSLGIKEGDIVTWYGRDRRKMNGDGVRGKVVRDRYGGYGIEDPDTGKTITAFGTAGRNWIAKVEASETKGIQEKKPAEKGLLFMTLPEIRERARQKDIKIPGDLKTKKDIVDWLADAEVAKENGEELPESPGQRQRREALEEKQRITRQVKEENATQKDARMRLAGERKRQREQEVAERKRLREEAAQLRRQQREDAARLKQIEREQERQRKAEERERDKQERARIRQEEKEQKKLGGVDDYDTLTGPGWTLSFLRKYAESENIRIPSWVKGKEEIRQYIIRRRSENIRRQGEQRHELSRIIVDAAKDDIDIPSVHRTAEAAAHWVESVKQIAALKGIDPVKYKPIVASTPEIQAGNTMSLRQLRDLVPHDTDPNHPVLIRRLDLEVFSGHAPNGRFKKTAHNLLVERRNGVYYVTEVGRTGKVDKPYMAAVVSYQLQQFHESLPPGSNDYQSAYFWYETFNPGDGHWKKEFNSPNHVSIAAAGGGGVSIWGRERSQRALPVHHQTSLHHEYGHNVDEKNGNISQGDDWYRAALSGVSPVIRDAQSRGHVSVDHFKVNHQLALDSDPRRAWSLGVTQYGKSSRGEDFAESMAMFMSGQIGTYRDKDGEIIPMWFRDIWPERAAILDKIFPQFASDQKDEIREARGFL